MKFGKQFHQLSPPAFAHYNIAYQSLKQAIPIIIGDAESADTQAANEVLSEFGAQAIGNAGRPPETRFNALLMHEVGKVGRCVEVHVQTWFDEAKAVLLQNSTVEQLDKLARDIEDLELYRRLNHTAFRKITKKFDKMVKNRVAEGGFGTWFMGRLEQEPCLTQSFDWMVALLDIGYSPSAPPSDEPLIVRRYWMPAPTRMKVLTTLVKHLKLNFTATLEKKRADMLSMNSLVDLPSTFSSRIHAAYFDTEDAADSGVTMLEWKYGAGLDEHVVRPPTQFEVELHTPAGSFSGSRQQWENGELGPRGANKQKTLAASRLRQLVFQDNGGSRVVLNESIVFGPLGPDTHLFEDAWAVAEGHSDTLERFPFAVLDVQTRGEPVWLSALQGQGILREVSNFDLGYHIVATLSRNVARPHWFAFLFDAIEEEPEARPKSTPKDRRSSPKGLPTMAFPSTPELLDEDAVIAAEILEESTYPLVEPKGYLANERTFIGWARIFLIMFAVSLHMLQKGMKNVEGNFLLFAFALVSSLICIGGILAALRIFLTRHESIRQDDISSAVFCNPIFPGAVTCSIVTILMVNVMLRI